MTGEQISKSPYLDLGPSCFENTLSLTAAPRFREDVPMLTRAHMPAHMSVPKAQVCIYMYFSSCLSLHDPDNTFIHEKYMYLHTCVHHLRVRWPYTYIYAVERMTLEVVNHVYTLTNRSY